MNTLLKRVYLPFVTVALALVLIGMFSNISMAGGGGGGDSGCAGIIDQLRSFDHHLAVIVSPKLRSPLVRLRAQLAREAQSCGVMVTKLTSGNSNPICADIRSELRDVNSELHDSSLSLFHRRWLIRIRVSLLAELRRLHC
jgi:hypothetical protein